MTFRILLFSFFSFCFLLTNAQEIVITPVATTYCKPGVSNKSPSKGVVFSYLNRPKLAFDGNTVNDTKNNAAGVNDRLRFKFKVPIIIREDFAFLIGMDYMREQYEFNTIDEERFFVFNSINDRSLKTARFSAYAIKPFNSWIYGSLKLEASYNGDYAQFVNFDQRYRIYRGAAFVGFKKREDKEWGVGLVVSTGFRNTRVFPFLLYNHTFNSKWGLETVLPAKITLRRNLTEKNNILFNARFGSRVYSIDVEENLAEPNIFNMQSAEIRWNVAFQQRIHPWIWLEAKGGYIQNFTNNIERVTPIPDDNFLSANQSGGAFMQFSIFLSPPRNKVEKQCK